MARKKGKGFGWTRKTLPSTQSQRSESVGSPSLSASISADGRAEDGSDALSNRQKLFGERDYFARSPSPQEDFGDPPVGNEWPVEKVIRFEVDYKGRTKYQVAWKNWQREDGTNTTWEELDPEPGPMLKFAKDAEAKAKAKARSSKGIDLTELCKHMPHDFLTGEALQGYEEKLRRYKLEESLIDEREWDYEANERRLADKRAGNNIQNSYLKRSRVLSDASENAVASSSKTPQVGHQTRRSSTESMTAVSNESRPLKRSKTKIESSDSMVPIMKVGPPRVGGVIKGVSRMSMSSTSALEDDTNQRVRMQDDWNSKLPRNAAKIYFVNDVDDEACPPVPPGFRYMERSYKHTPETRKKLEDAEPALGGCNCEGGCDTLSCFCVADSQCEEADNDEDKTPTTAYDKNGLFKFTQTWEVLECNKNCTCNRKCKNIVAQKARKFELEIFKTRHIGWSVRPRTKLVRGTVLGIYTGKVLKRECVAKLSETENDFTFDLDLRDSVDDYDGEKYTVCAHKYGNWTRFVNHSCEPNAEVYNVVFDSDPGMNIPYLAFVASRDIRAYEDITIDYKRVDGKTSCKCSTPSCRSFC